MSTRDCQKQRISNTERAALFKVRLKLVAVIALAILMGGCSSFLEQRFAGSRAISASYVRASDAALAKENGIGEATHTPHVRSPLPSPALELSQTKDANSISPADDSTGRVDLTQFVVAEPNERQSDEPTQNRQQITPTFGIAATGHNNSPPPVESSSAYSGRVMPQWRPPGIAGIWPPDEYLVDGGDNMPYVQVTPQWQVRGLAPSETVAHYDTLDGCRVVERSNPVAIYSPRFAAVRQVIDVRANVQAAAGAGLVQPVAPRSEEASQPVFHSKQLVEAIAQAGTKPPVIVYSEQYAGVVGVRHVVGAVDNSFLPYENFAVIRSGKIEVEEIPLLAEAATAAEVWTNVAAVQVILDRVRATETKNASSIGSVYTVKEKTGTPRLRIIKVASKSAAAPGEFVDFTIRFDNVGDETIGNVTIVDNLTARLEYVPNSAQCSLPAELFTEENESGSLILRWEITDPLKPGQGGIIRFRCRVR